MFSKDFRSILCLLTFYQISYVYCDFPMLGPGDVNIKKILQCENPEQYPSSAVIEKKKLNRTHEIFNLELNLKDDLDDTVGFHLNVEKWGDGGYKPNFLIVDGKNACEEVFKYFPNDIKIMLETIGRPPKCPITKVSAKFSHYIDHTKLPQEMLYGDFKGRLFLVKDGVSTSCIEMYGEITPKKLFTN